MRPSQDAISLDKVMPLAPSMDTAGVYTRRSIDLKVPHIRVLRLLHQESCDAGSGRQGMARLAFAILYGVPSSAPIVSHAVLSSH